MMRELIRAKSERREDLGIGAIGDARHQRRGERDLDKRQWMSFLSQIGLPEIGAAKAAQRFGDCMVRCIGQVPHGRCVIQIEPAYSLSGHQVRTREGRPLRGLLVPGKATPRLAVDAQAKAPVRAACTAAITAVTSPSASTSSGRRSLRWGLLPCSQPETASGS